MAFYRPGEPVEIIGDVCPEYTGKKKKKKSQLWLLMVVGSRVVILLRPAGQERSDDHVCPNVPSVLALQIPRPESAFTMLTIPGSNSATGVSQSRASRIRCLTCGPKTPLWRQIARRVLVCRSCHFLTLSGYSALAKPMAKSGRLSKIPSVVRGPSVLPNLLMIFPMRSRSNSCVNIVQVDPTSCTVSLQPEWGKGGRRGKRARINDPSSPSQTYQKTF